MTHPKIITSPVFPPIPTTQFDWAAVFDGYEPGQHIGYGRDAQEATADLIEQWEDDQPANEYVRDNGQFGVGA